MARKDRFSAGGGDEQGSQVQMEGRVAGFIKRLVKDKGFGFIRDEGGKEYFFHRSSLTGDTNFDALAEGDKVTYLPGRSEKGPRAQDVTVAD